MIQDDKKTRRSFRDNVDKVPDTSGEKRIESICCGVSEISRKEFQKVRRFREITRSDY